MFANSVVYIQAVQTKLEPGITIKSPISVGGKLALGSTADRVES